MPKRLREWATTWAVSPIAKISGWSGTDRSEFTMILPDLSVAEFIHRPAGEARTPAPQSTVALETRWLLAIIPSAAMLVTRVLVKTLTPNCSKLRRALAERTSGFDGSTRGGD